MKFDLPLYHYSGHSIDPFERGKFYDQSKMRWHAKPYGFWVSVGEGWKEWCEDADFCLSSLSYKYEVILFENANILHLKSAEEILEFSKKYHKSTRDWDIKSDTYQLDWDKVRQEYQGIIISPYQYYCRLNMDCNWYYGWDCASGCIWDLSCIQEFIFREYKEYPNGENEYDIRFFPLNDTSKESAII